MPRHQTFKRSGLAIAALVLAVAGTERLSYGLGECLDGCSPTTPCPCAADGVCRPKRDSWGVYKTRWRAWPGEETSQTPTLADPGTSNENTVVPLPDYEPPLPVQEDLRAPPKAKRKTSDDDEAAAPIDLPGEEPAQLLPGPGPAPAADGPQDFDPFSQQPSPSMDDAPPTLPASLRQAAVSMGMPRLGKTQHVPTAKLGNSMPTTATQPIHQVSWQSSPSIQLVNPASATVEPVAEPLQQAIYYEASDQVE